MAMTDELNKLRDLHQSGALTDDEFSRAKDRLLGAASTPDGPADSPADVSPLIAKLNALRRSSQDRWIAGVCGGLARGTGVQSWIWRLLFTALALCGGAGLVIYLMLWIFMPADTTSTGASSST